MSIEIMGLNFLNELILNNSVDYLIKQRTYLDGRFDYDI